VVEGILRVDSHTGSNWVRHYSEHMLDTPFPVGLGNCLETIGADREHIIKSSSCQLSRHGISGGEIVLGIKSLELHRAALDIPVIAERIAQAAHAFIQNYLRAVLENCDPGQADGWRSAPVPVRDEKDSSGCGDQDEPYTQPPDGVPRSIHVSS